MKYFFLLLLIANAALAQKNSDLFNSNKLGQSLELTIELPKSYTKNIKDKYPLLILLDGNYLFDPFSGAVSYASYWEDLPEMIIVGINMNTDDRESLYSYDETLGVPDKRGSKFFEFVGAELLPYLEKKFRIAPFKIIAGHDLSAGFLNFFLYKDQPMFNGYIALSPELATNMENILPQRLSLIKQPIFYYHAVSDGDIDDIKDSEKKLDSVVKTMPNPASVYKFEEIKNSTHYSLVLKAIPNALYHIFDTYKPITSEEYEKILTLKSGYANYLSKKYSDINKSLGIEMIVRLNDIKAVETAILKNKLYDELDKLSELSLKNYPKSMLADYYLALMYEKTGDFKKATKYYTTAFTKNEIGDLTKDMMINKASELKKGKSK